MLKSKMSDTAEDLIMLSPRAPNQPLQASATCPAAPAGALEANPRPWLHAISTSQRLHKLEASKEDAVVEGKEPAAAYEEEITKTIAEDYSKTHAAPIAQAQCGRVVVISPLPKSITKRDILCRIRGGKVLSCILSEFCDWPLAAITFQDPVSAQRYVHFCADTSNKALWSFPSDPISASSTRETMTSRVSIYKDAPGLGTTWNPEDIPSCPRICPPYATRCLLLENCHIEGVAKVWAELGLNNSEHLRNQLDDMWLEQLTGDATLAGKVFGTLHIWYADIMSAVQAQQSCPDLKYEMDPCLSMPQDSLILDDDGIEGKVQDGAGDMPNNTHIKHHSFPFASLLDLHKASVMDGLSKGTLDPYVVFGCTTSTETLEEQAKDMSLTDRLTHVLRTYGKTQRRGVHGSDQARMLPPIGPMLSALTRTAGNQFEAPGFAVRTTGGADDPFQDAQGALRGYESYQPGNFFTRTIGDHGPSQVSASHIHFQHLRDRHTNRHVSECESPRENDTHHVGVQCVNRPPFEMARPQPGYTLQFPPPMSGDLPAVRYPSTLDQASSRESPVQTHLAHRLWYAADPNHTPFPMPSLAPSKPAQGSTGYQSGRSTGSGRTP